MPVLVLGYWLFSTSTFIVLLAMYRWKKVQREGFAFGLFMVLVFGSRFVLDPERPASLQMLDIKVEPDAPAIEVLIDGKSLRARTRSWPLAPGDHAITLRGAGVSSSAVRFSVH